MVNRMIMWDNQTIGCVVIRGRYGIVCMLQLVRGHYDLGRYGVRIIITC